MQKDCANRPLFAELQIFFLPVGMGYDFDSRTGQEDSLSF